MAQAVTFEVREKRDLGIQLHVALEANCESL